MAPYKRILRFAELQERGIRFSRTHIRRLIAELKFPPPVHIGEHSIGWPEEDIEAWEQRIRAERDQRFAAKHPDLPALPDTSTPPAKRPRKQPRKVADAPPDAPVPLAAAGRR